jgi:hypothetical protein
MWWLLLFFEVMIQNCCYCFQAWIAWHPEPECLKYWCSATNTGFHTGSIPDLVSCCWDSDIAPPRKNTADSCRWLFGRLRKEMGCTHSSSGSVLPPTQWRISIQSGQVIEFAVFRNKLLEEFCWHKEARARLAQACIIIIRNIVICCSYLLLEDRLTYIGEKTSVSVGPQETQFAQGTHRRSLPVSNATK